MSVNIKGCVKYLLYSVLTLALRGHKRKLLPREPSSRYRPWETLPRLRPLGHCILPRPSYCQPVLTPVSFAYHQAALCYLLTTRFCRDACGTKYQAWYLETVRRRRIETSDHTNNTTVLCRRSVSNTVLCCTQSTALNGSDPPCSSPASTAVRTAAKYSLSLRPFSPANSVNNMYRESATTFAKSKACRTLLEQRKGKKWWLAMRTRE